MLRQFIAVAFKQHCRGIFSNKFGLIMLRIFVSETLFCLFRLRSSKLNNRQPAIMPAAPAANADINTVVIAIEVCLLRLFFALGQLPGNGT